MQHNKTLYTFVLLGVLIVLSCLVCISCCTMDDNVISYMGKEGLLVGYELNNTSDLVTDISVNDAIDVVTTNMNMVLDGLDNDLKEVETTINDF